MQKFDNVKDRKRVGETLVKAYTEMLRRGWNPNTLKIQPATTYNSVIDCLENALEKTTTIKASTTNTRKHQFWRQVNKPFELWSNEVIQQKIDYIHNNPVEEGMVFRPKDYKYSSAPDYAGEKSLLGGVCVFQHFRL